MSRGTDTKKTSITTFIDDLIKTTRRSEEIALIALVCKPFKVRLTCITSGTGKNTKIRMPSDERNRQKLNDLLAVGVQRGTTVLIYLPKDFRQLDFVLDNVRIRGRRLETGVYELLAEIARQVVFPEFSLNFSRTPSYSPCVNPAEYLILAIREDGLYHVPYT